MAKLGDITIKTAEYRPCYVTEAVAYSDGVPYMRHERKALFHRYAQKQTAVIKTVGSVNHYPWKVLEMVKRDYDERGYLQPGFDVDVHTETVAIVEFEDGNVAEVDPTAVRFVPGLMNEYDFAEAVNETCNSVHKGER